MKKLLSKFELNIRDIFSIAFIFSLFLLYNHKLVTNLSTALTDWLDYPLIVYILEQNIKHLSSLDFSNIGNMSQFYPTPGGMFFTDILLVQGVIGTIIFPFTKNYILTHNLIFLLTAFTNIIALHYFWGKLFKNKFIVFILSLLFTFSPYYFTQYVHYQMLPYALFFFSAGLLTSKTNNRNIFLAGLLSGLQFLAGVYLGFFSLAFTGLFFLWKLIKEKKVKKFLLSITIYSIGFLLISGYFVYQYTHIKDVYQIERSPGEYIDLAIQVFDVFFNPYSSLWVNNIYKHVNVHNHRIGSENFTAGYILLFSVIAGIYLSVKKLKNKYNLFFYILLLWGIVASLGPRLAINGRYFGTPLPYIFFLKFTPLFDSLRRTGAWFFLVQISLLYFVGILLKWSLKKYKIKKVLFGTLILLVLYSIEMLPLQQRTTVQDYQSYAYQPLVENCKDDELLLELPFSPMQPKTHTVTTLNYWVKMLLNQIHHECNIVNGYSGFAPKHYTDFIDKLEPAMIAGETDEIYQALATKDINYIKVNIEKLYNVPDAFLELLKSDKYSILLDDEQYLIVKINQ